MNNMSNEVLSILEKCGWTLERVIDPSDIIVLLRSRGFTITDPMISFIKRFGMLDIKSPSILPYDTVKKLGFDAYDEHTTDVFSALGDFGRASYTEQFEDFIKEKLTIVGEVQNGHLTLMISESGKFYCEEGKLGDTVEEAWECILTNNRKLIHWSNIK